MHTNGKLVPANGATLPPVPPPITHNRNTVSALAGAQYVAAESTHAWLNYLQALPRYVDDLTRDFGDDIYDRMMIDPQVYSCTAILKAIILADGYQLQPHDAAAETGNADDNEDARKICDYCKWMLENLDRSFLAVLYELLDGCFFGHKLAEKTVVVDNYDRESRKVHRLRAITPKNRRSYAFVVDAFYDVVAIVGIIPGRTGSFIINQLVADLANLPNALPLSKFVVFTHNMKDNDPRGRSLLRHVYTPWWNKQQVIGEDLKYLARFGSPSVHGTTAEGARSRFTMDAEGNPIPGTEVTPEQDMLTALKQLANGAAIATPAGSTVAMVTPPTGAPFSEALERYDKQIAKGILNQTLATEEAQHMARAASDTHKDVLDVGVSPIRAHLAHVVRAGILYDQVAANYGHAAAKRYTPKVVIGPRENRAIIDYASAVSTLVSCGFLTEDQWAYVDEKLGLPHRAKEELEAMRKQKQQQQGGNQLPGGKGDGLANEDVDQEQLAKGRKVEMEHTDDPAKAEEIARDHLAEDLKYYDKLNDGGDDLDQLLKKIDSVGFAYEESKHPRGGKNPGWFTHKSAAHGKAIEAGSAKEHKAALENHLVVNQPIVNTYNELRSDLKQLIDNDASEHAINRVKSMIKMLEPSFEQGNQKTKELQAAHKLATEEESHQQKHATAHEKRTGQLKAVGAELKRLIEFRKRASKGGEVGKLVISRIDKEIAVKRRQFEAMAQQHRELGPAEPNEDTPEAPTVPKDTANVIAKAVVAILSAIRGGG